MALLAKWAPVIRGHGIPEAMEAILEKQARIRPRAAIAKPLSAAIAIGSGAPFGAEGPIIVTVGSLGSLIGQVIPVSPAERKILLACGAAAGMAATFGTPIAAVILAIELLLFEFSTRAFIPLVVASTIATGLHVLLLDAGPLFEVPPHDYAGLGQLPLYALLGLACGGLAIVINRGLFAVERVYQRLPVDEFWHPVLGALVFGTLGLLVPRALGVGYDVISDTLDGRLGVTALLTILVGPIVDEGRLVGIVSRRDILYSDLDDAISLLDVASRDVVTVSPDDNAHDALEKMLAGGFGHVPVTDRHDLVGMITRTDLVRARIRELEMEQRQPPTWRRPRPPTDSDSTSD